MCYPLPAARTEGQGAYPVDAGNRIRGRLRTEDVPKIVAAFDAADELRLIGREDPATLMVAKMIIELARQGEVQAVFGTSRSSARYWTQIPGKRNKDVSRGIYTGRAADAVLPKPRIRLRPGVYRAAPGIGSVQRCAWPQGTTRALAANDA